MTKESNDPNCHPFHPQSEKWDLKESYVIEHVYLLSYQFEWHPKQLLQHSLIATGLIHP